MKLFYIIDGKYHQMIVKRENLNEAFFQGLIEKINIIGYPIIMVSHEIDLEHMGVDPSDILTLTNEQSN